MKKILIGMLVLGLAFSGCFKKKDRISPQEEKAVNEILAHWKTWVPSRQKAGVAPLLTFAELYTGLSEDGARFLDKVRAVKPGGVFPEAQKLMLARIDFQKYERNGKTVVIDTQYLPTEVYSAMRIMLAEMQKDLGKQLLVESGYRSPAYQLYQFVYYMPKHGYSIKETNRWVALPGHSEHGNPARQAIDFINMQGINGDDDGQTAETFEKLPEYEWLQRRAGEFGFHLSYPKGGKDTVFEPWHWHYAGESVPAPAP